MSSLLARLQAVAASECLSYLGVASLETSRDAIVTTGSHWAAAFPRAVSLGIAMPFSIVDLLPSRDQAAVSVAYHTHAYHVLNARLDLAASKLASVLQDASFRALPVAAAERVDSDRVCAFVSHKLVARLAGLGWIGKNCLLITPKYGPRVRWTSILTDAPLEATRRWMAPQCGRCRACASACPAGALKDREFAEDEPRSARLDATACERYIRSLANRVDHAPVCGMCLYACPHGSRLTGTPSAP